MCIDIFNYDMNRFETSIFSIVSPIFINEYISCSDINLLVENFQIFHSSYLGGLYWTIIRNKYI